MTRFETEIFFFNFSRTLDENTRNIYKENVDLHESIRIYKREIEQLENSREQLSKFFNSINNDRQMNDALMKEKVEQVQKNRTVIKEVREKFPFFQNFSRIANGRAQISGFHFSRLNFNSFSMKRTAVILTFSFRFTFEKLS